MSKIDFAKMQQKELHAYVLAHQEAFYAYIDKLHAEATWVEMLPSQSVDDLKNYPEFLDVSVKV